ncbi:MAG: hypothetical protein J7M18_08475 [Candidatus Eremiobacteraeota bacterium]|nr:hypothetical protein [Candidatus Eremiobacteraeota bacterium]
MGRYFSHERVGMGDYVQAVITMTNLTPSTTGALEVNLPVPAVLEPLLGILDEMKKKHELLEYTVENGEMYLQLPGLLPNERRRITVPFLATIPGKVSTGSCSISLLHQPEIRDCQGPSVIEVR